MTTYEEILASLPEDQRAQVVARAERLIREEKVRRSTVPWRRLATRGIEGKPGLPRQLERLATRADMSIGALRRQVAAMRGKLRVVVEIEGRPPVELKRLGSRALAAE